MNAPPGFRTLSSPAAGEAIAFRFDGEPMVTPAGRSVAAALLAGSVPVFRRTPVSGSGRAPYCMMGVCFDCLVEIDGVPNRQACLVPIREGMEVRTQQGQRRTEMPEGTRDGE